MEDRPFLGMVCVINVFVCEKARRFFIYIVRGEGHAPEIYITKPARFDELENIYLLVV